MDGVHIGISAFRNCCKQIESFLKWKTNIFNQIVLIGMTIGSYYLCLESYVICLLIPVLIVISFYLVSYFLLFQLHVK